MLTYLFTYLGIDSMFLEYVFATVFREHLEAQDAYFSGLDEAHCIAIPQPSQSFPELGRSGRAVRLCYNLRSVERKPNWIPREYELAWSVKSLAVYHTFDIETAHSLWLTCDSSLEARDHIKTWISGPERFDLKTNSGRFLATLTTHLLICDWAVQNWRWYLKELEDEAQKIALETRTFALEGQGYHQHFSPILAISSTQPSAISTGRFHTRSTPKSFSRTPKVGFPMNTPPPPPPPISGTRAPPPPSAAPPHEAPPEASTKDEELLAFKDIQQIDLLEEQAGEAVLVLKLNIEILLDLYTQYKVILEDEAFPEEIKRDGKIGILQFFKNLEGIRSRFEKQLNRTDRLLKQLDHRKNSTFFLIQYRNMLQSRRSAIEMEKMTANMARVANKTQQEAISMRIITLVTLFFLPATAIATIFGSGMVIFKENDTIAIGTRTLGLYLAICIPLTIVTFFVWWLMMRGIPLFKSKYNPSLIKKLGSREANGKVMDNSV
ncbi:hypothetical protein N0V90_000618 [Kalmusia sp. IMI 367209]|nr:hypothetical protein N0V90_000618 [Kalmusia sp. IMI 367209]